MRAATAGIAMWYIATIIKFNDCIKISYSGKKGRYLKLKRVKNEDL